jgi:hypothetical protein
VTPKLASLLFMGAWTALAIGIGVWTWRRWRHSRQLRVVRTWFGEIEESNLPTMFAILSASEIVGVVVAAIFSLIGLYLFVSLLGS